MAIAMPAWHTTYHHQLTSLGRKAGVCATVAGLVAAVSSIVIFSSCLCLTLPGINVLNAVILPGMLPGGLGLALSIPLFALTYRYALQKREIRAQWMPQIKAEMETLRNDSEKEWAKSFVDRLFSAPWSTECKRKLIMDLLKDYGDKESPEHKMLTEALKMALGSKKDLTKS